MRNLATSIRLSRAAANGISYIAADAATADLAPTFRGADAVVSCVGVLPGLGCSGGGCATANGAVNVRIAEAAKAAAVSRFVYISVASELASSALLSAHGGVAIGVAQALPVDSTPHGPPPASASGGASPP